MQVVVGSPLLIENSLRTSIEVFIFAQTSPSTVDLRHTCLIEEEKTKQVCCDTREKLVVFVFLRQKLDNCIVGYFSLFRVADHEEIGQDKDSKVLSDACIHSLRNSHGELAFEEGSFLVANSFENDSSEAHSLHSLRVIPQVLLLNRSATDLRIRLAVGARNSILLQALSIEELPPFSKQEVNYGIYLSTNCNEGSAWHEIRFVENVEAGIVFVHVGSQQSLTSPCSIQQTVQIVYQISRKADKSIVVEFCNRIEVMNRTERCVFMASEGLQATPVLPSSRFYPRTLSVYGSRGRASSAPVGDHHRSVGGKASHEVIQSKHHGGRRRSYAYAKRETQTSTPNDFSTELSVSCFSEDRG